jgi:hypothetical protein
MKERLSIHRETVRVLHETETSLAAAGSGTASRDIACEATFGACAVISRAICPPNTTTL